MQRATERFSVILVIVSVIMLASFSVTQAIEVRPAGSGDLQITFEPLKPVYNTGEKIQFRVRGNHSFYLYLFSINDRNNTGYIILPNVYQMKNRYNPDRDYLVPASNVEFFSDSPGTERVVMVASTKPLDLNLSQYSKSGDFFSSDAATLDGTVKSLRIREAVRRVYKEISLVVIGQ